MTAAELDARIALAAERAAVYCHHVRDSRLDIGPGWPDWTFVGPGGLLFRECKTGGGRLTPEQRALGYALQALGHDWAVWHEGDWWSGLIEREIGALRARSYPTSNVRQLV